MAGGNQEEMSPAEGRGGWETPRPVSITCFDNDRNYRIPGKSAVTAPRHGNGAHEGLNHEEHEGHEEREGHEDNDN
jgi:hypothetical protein